MTRRGRAIVKAKIQPACKRGVRQCACAHGLARGSRDTNLYRGWGAAFWVAIQRAAWLVEGRDTKFCIVAKGGDSRSRHSAATAAIRLPALCNTGVGALRHSRKAHYTAEEPAIRRVGTRRHRAIILPGQARDIAGPGLQHCRARLATRLGQACDRARPATRRSACVVCVQVLIENQNTCIQVYVVITTGLLINPRQQYHKTC